MNSVISKFTKKDASSKKIKVDFEGKVDWKTRMAMRVFNKKFAVQVILAIFRYVFLIGISYIILYPFFTKISASFMSSDDFVDVTVKLIPKYPTLDNYKFIFIENKYLEALFNSATLALLSAFIQTMITAFIGYGFAKFKFKGRGLLVMRVILTMVVPHKTLQLAMFMKFKYFDIYGIYGAISSLFGAKTTWIDLINTYWPLTILSLGGLAFKNGLYIFIFRQFYKGVPDELEEAAYVDGSGIFRTYFQIILPLTISIMVTVFMFAFSWQWTDTYYTSLFFTATGPHLLPAVVSVPQSLSTSYAAAPLRESAVLNTAGLMVIAPLFIIFLFAQKSLVQSIERSGIVG